MSRYCAKPTCSEFANTWFELSRERQRVVRSETSSKHAIGLCESHGDRFKVPEGWTFETNRAAVGQAEAPPRRLDDENPWFFPAGAVPVENAPSGQGGQSAGTSSGSQLDNTEEGTMLDRAFHGPKEREGGRNRSNSDELEGESPDPLQTGELPFPPQSVATF